MPRILTVVGARPQFVKAAVVSRAIAELRATGEVILEESIVHTGQHYDDAMSSVFFREMDIPEPAFHLGVGGGSHGAMTGRMLEAIERVLIDTQPDAVLVYGDTNSTLAGALAAAKLHIRVAHVEAGLRSFNRKMPEELNRVLADQLSAWLYCPTDAAVRNLDAEGIRGPRVVRTGDVMYDAAVHYARRAAPTDTVAGLIEGTDRPVCLATVHRAENTDDPARLRAIMSALATLATKATVVLPLHPRTAKMVAASGVSTGRVNIVGPVGYFDMLYLLQRCSLVLTDSGGLQKEAYFFDKPCLTMRDQTEWVELVESGCNELVGADAGRILAAAERTLAAPPRFSPGLYGDGAAGHAIARHLATVLAG